MYKELTCDCPFNRTWFCLPPGQDSRGNYTTLNPIYAKQFWMPDIFIGKYMHIFPYELKSILFGMYVTV
jgi:hypothetical protein